MRPSRSDVLADLSGRVHVMWRCHNREMLLREERLKALYFECVVSGLEHAKVDSNVKLTAFCFMDNHVHKLMSYDRGADKLSAFMHASNTRFGLRYNRAKNRSGKVSNERPKTSLVLDLEGEMRAHFYIEANPVRAKLVKRHKLREYKWNSYRFYAHGEVDVVTEHLTPPEWYLALGETSQERQEKYRLLFSEYLDEVEGNASVATLEMARRFIGSAAIVRLRQEALKQKLLKKMEAKAGLPDWNRFPKTECAVLLSDPGLPPG